MLITGSHASTVVCAHVLLLWQPVDITVSTTVASVNINCVLP